MKLLKLIKGTGVICPASTSDMEISGIAYDSRNVVSGNAFVCIKGYKTDGHEYIDSAIKKGASVIFAERTVETGSIPVILSSDNRILLSRISANYFGEPTKNLEIFGVTGTNGKTTISFLIKEILETSNVNCGLIGTIEYSYGGTKYESNNTTPESFELQRIFAEMKAAGSKACSMEVSSHAIALHRVADVDFDYGVFTNLTPEHMDFHSDFEEYYNTKKKLFLMINKSGLINIDDKYGSRLYKELFSENRQVYSFSAQDKEADYFASINETSAKGTMIEVTKNGNKLGSLIVNTPGNFSVSNALAAAATCYEAGFTWEAIEAGIKHIKGVPGRFETVENSKGVVAIVDYAHTPDALVNVLNTARTFTRGSIITVFGCGGDRDKTKRPLMGKAAGELSEYCIVTSDNPRTEDPSEILKEVVEGVKETGCEFEVQEDRYKAIEAAIRKYQDWDVIIIAGKGHEDYQIIGTEKHHFDDREAAREIIEREK